MNTDRQSSLECCAHREPGVPFCQGLRRVAPEALHCWRQSALPLYLLHGRTFPLRANRPGEMGNYVASSCEAPCETCCSDASEKLLQTRARRPFGLPDLVRWAGCELARAAAYSCCLEGADPDPHRSQASLQAPERLSSFAPSGTARDPESGGPVPASHTAQCKEQPVEHHSADFTRMTGQIESPPQNESPRFFERPRRPQADTALQQSAGAAAHAFCRTPNILKPTLRITGEKPDSSLQTAKFHAMPACRAKTAADSPQCVGVAEWYKTHKRREQQSSSPRSARSPRDSGQVPALLLAVSSCA